MHELSMAQGIINAVIDTAESNNATEVNEVTIELGRLAMVNPEQLKFILGVLVENTIVEDAEINFAEETKYVYYNASKEEYMPLTNEPIDETYIEECKKSFQMAREFFPKYFPEYKYCIDKNHKKFNSNYGYYAKKGLSNCINELLSKKSSRQACFMINNNTAMEPSSIDKLCTNAIMFFIRGNCLHMIVQMRSSNLLTLLPYDMFIFSIWYAKVYNALISEYPMLRLAQIKVHFLVYIAHCKNTPISVLGEHYPCTMFCYCP